MSRTGKWTTQSCGTAKKMKNLRHVAFHSYGIVSQRNYSSVALYEKSYLNRSLLTQEIKYKETKKETKGQKKGKIKSVEKENRRKK